MCLCISSTLPSTEKNGLDYFDYDIYMYDQIIWESTKQNYKKKFEAPKKRMIRVEKNAKDETPAP